MEKMVQATLNFNKSCLVLLSPYPKGERTTVASLFLIFLIPNFKLGNEKIPI